MTREISTAQALRYSRQINLPGFDLDGQERLLASRVLIMGLAFKEDCPDIRNTKVVDVINELEEYGCNVDVFDPVVEASDVKSEYNIDLINWVENEAYDAVVIAVGHNKFKAMGPTKIKNFGKKKSTIYDLKSIFSNSQSDLRL